MTEDKMIGWHHQLNGHEFKQTLGDGEGYGSLVWCNSWGLRELDTTEQLHNNRAITFARQHCNGVLAAGAEWLQSCQTLCDPIDGSPPGPPSLGFSRQEHRSGLPFPSTMH